MNELVIDYLNNKINMLKEKLNLINLENDIYTPLLAKKIEYTSFFIDSALRELEEIENDIENNLIDKKEYVNKSLEEYSSMEDYIMPNL
tara:strand:+ start:8697 stop:8963 length:267 start_codon:yes stop_codon:yes gene_type:complete